MYHPPSLTSGIERLERRSLLSGLNLVGNWNGGLTQFSDLWAEGNFVYLGHRLAKPVGNRLVEQGVDIVNISDPSNPVLASVFMGSGDNIIRDVTVQNGIGFFASQATTGGGVYVVDVNNPYDPTQLAFVTMAQGGLLNIHAIAVNGNYLYECNKTPTVAVFDISNPSSPQFVTDLVSPAGQDIHEVTAEGGRLYAASISGPGIVDIWDVASLPASAPLLSEFVSGPATHTAWPTANGDILAVTHETTGGTVSLWDISNLADPKLLSTLPALPASQTFSANSIMIVGNIFTYPGTRRACSRSTSAIQPTRYWWGRTTRSPAPTTACTQALGDRRPVGHQPDRGQRHPDRALRSVAPHRVDPGPGV